jgi:hypothetical protein
MGEFFTEMLITLNITMDKSRIRKIRISLSSIRHGEISLSLLSPNKKLLNLKKKEPKKQEDLQSRNSINTCPG